jgi:hypothetical protein
MENSTMSEIVIFEQLEADILLLERANKEKKFDVEIPEEYQDCQDWCKKHRKVEIGLEKLRKEAKSDYLRLGREVDAEAKSWTERVAVMAAPHRALLADKEARLQAVIDAKAKEAEAKAEYEEDERLAWLEYRERKAQAIIDAAEKAEKDKAAEIEKINAAVLTEKKQKEAVAEAVAKTKREAAKETERVAAAQFEKERKEHEEKNQLAAEKLQRELDEDHRNQIHGEIYRELRKLLAPLDTQAVLDALNAGQIPHTKIKY